MISRVSTTNTNFKSYFQKFTDREFQQTLEESLVWAKENVDCSKYFRTKKMMNKKLESNANNALNILQNYKQVFKKSDFESHVELSLQERELVGKVTHVSSTPVEVRTELPCNIKDFFKKIKNSAKAQIKEENLSQKWWETRESIKYFEAKQRVRYRELTQKGEKEPNPFILYIDSIYMSISEKLIKLTEKKNELEMYLDDLKPMLKDKSFKLKIK